MNCPEPLTSVLYQVPVATHPYRNRTPTDLPGEVWRDIDGFENCYQVSSLGRVRSLGRFVPHRHGKPVWVDGKVLAQTHRWDKNERTGEPTVALRVALQRDGVRHDLTVRRLVYGAFKQRDLPADKVVLNQDGDGWNNRVENLQLVSRREKGLRVIARGRDTNTLATIDRSHWPKTYGGYSRSKPVARCELTTGHLLEEYPSIAEAARLTRGDAKSILQVVKGRKPHYRGFAWTYLPHQPTGTE